MGRIFGDAPRKRTAGACSSRAMRLAMVAMLALVAPRVVAGSGDSVVSGTVRDASGLPLPGAVVQLTAAKGDDRAEATTDSQGRYVLSASKPGEHEIHATLSGFQPAHHQLRLSPGQRVVLDVRLQIEAVTESLTVRGQPGARPDFSRVFITRNDLDHIPGALQTGSCTAITELSPSAVTTHDQLHVRGGHQVGYEIDGVPVPSASIGANFALLFDPKDVDAIDFQRGAYSAEYGDRLYGVVDVVTRSGFERAKSGESTVIAGQQRTVEGALAYGDHTDKVAYFAQMSGNRTDLGLTPPALPARNDRTWGAGGAARLWVGHDTDRTLAVTASSRVDNYQIPLVGSDAAETAADTQRERDAYVHAQWSHTGAARGVWSLTPYYHFNRVALDAAGQPTAALASDDRRIHYLGVKADRSTAFGRHLLKLGADANGEFLRDRFLLPLGEASGDGGAALVRDSVTRAGINTAAYVEDVYHAADQVTATVGLRWDRTQAWQTEWALQPRFGLQAKLPATPLLAHLYAGRFFQPPPFEALGVGGAQFAAVGDQAFLLVRAERNTQWETGVTWPMNGASIDLTYYDNRARHFLDHEQLGESSVFLPVNIAQARLRGLEVTAASAPGKRLRARVVFARSYAQARGGITGGLGDLDPRSEGGWFPLDHDQRNSGVVSLDWTITRTAWTHLAIEYGSGFLRADGPDHLPSHVTADLAGGFSFRGGWSLAADLLNLTDRRYFINLSSEFNGTHVARPRTVLMRLCRRF